MTLPRTAELDLRSTGEISKWHAKHFEVAQGLQTRTRTAHEQDAQARRILLDVVDRIELAA